MLINEGVDYAGRQESMSSRLTKRRRIYAVSISRGSLLEHRLSRQLARYKSERDFPPPHLLLDSRVLAQAELQNYSYLSICLNNF